MEDIFFLKGIKGGKVVASFVGYQNDTLSEKGRTHFHFVLRSSEDVLKEVEVKSSSTFVSKIEPRHTEYISSRELTKAPCCNLSESFETNASVDVSTTDAITGTKQIQMLGLSGKYSPLVRENIPVFNSILINNGLNLVPGTSVSSIAISKGPGSVTNGYNSMTGLINFDLIKPNEGDKLFVNLFASSIGRLEVNANVSQLKVPGDSSYFNAMIHYSEVFLERDINNDGFRDFPKSQRGSFMGRYRRFGEKSIILKLGWYWHRRMWKVVKWAMMRIIVLACMGPILKPRTSKYLEKQVSFFQTSLMLELEHFIRFLILKLIRNMA